MVRRCLAPLDREMAGLFLALTKDLEAEPAATWRAQGIEPRPHLVEAVAAELLGMTFRSFRYYAKKLGLIQPGCPARVEIFPSDMEAFETASISLTLIGSSFR